jgi:glyoxylase-like metal-dependent hydrolase (beta-lactamase superfamily II)
VGDGCFRRRYPRFDLNIGVVRGSDGLLVIDTRSDLREADELLDELAHFGRPVRWVVNSHWHFDHVFGNQRFVEQAHGAERREGSAEVDTELELWGHVDLPAMLLDDEADLRSRLRAFYGDEQADEFDRVVLTPPDRLVVDHHVLDLGDRGVDLVHLGRGHTNNDLVVVAANGGTVFAGDLLEESAPPAYGDDSYPLEWPATADLLAASGAATFVPGHGDVMTPSSARDQAGAITAVARLITELYEAGIPVGDALQAAEGRWPYPANALAEAVQRGYDALG